MTDLVQGSTEWFAARLGRVTASRVADVIAKTKTGYGASRENYLAELVLERLTGKAEEGFTSSAMQWGTGTRIAVELSDELLALIDKTPREGLHLIESTQGKPFTKESFGNWFRDACTEAGVTKSAHGLRKLSATMAAEGGAATHQLLAQYGWTNISTAEIYTKGIDRKRLGIEASRIVADQIENIISPHPKSGEGIYSKNTIKTKAKK